MNDFWARKLSQSPGAPPTQHQQQPQRGGLGPTGTPWWASSAYGAGAQVQPQQPLSQPQPDPEYVTVRAVSAKVDSHCPGCGGTSYFRPTTNTQAHCFDCGYQDRFRQSMSGLAVVHDTTAVSKPSIRQATGTYQPQTIVGRL